MHLSFLSRFFKHGGDETAVVSRKAAGRFRVDEVLEIIGKQVLVGEVIEGVIYPGYKVKGEGAAPIRAIQRDKKSVDFAVEYDRVALILEGHISAVKGEIVEIYRS